MTDDERLLKEASAWVERMSLPVIDAAQGKAFDAWMAADERHADAFARLLALWDGREIETALITAPANDDVATPAVAPSPRRRLRPLAAGAALLLAIAGALPFLPSSGVTSYHAGKGQMRHIALSDGTTVDLAPDTDLAVQILPWDRKVTLSKGEAYFDVHHERWRGFTVDSEAGSTRVLGTAFDVDLQGPKQLAVQVYRGAVRFRTDALGDIVLRAGSMGRLEKGAFRLSRFDARHRTPAWQDGWFDADDISLDTVIAMVNRYTDQPIVVRDGNDLRRRVSGRFKVSDRAAFLTALRYGYGVDAH